MSRATRTMEGRSYRGLDNQTNDYGVGIYNTILMLRNSENSIGKCLSHLVSCLCCRFFAFCLLSHPEISL